MSTARNIPTAIPELDYGEPPRDKEPRRSRSRSLRSVASLVLGKQNTKPSPNESNPPAPTSRWPAISALRRSQKNALPPHPEGTTSAGDATANADLYTRDRRSADIPNRRFSLSRPIRLSLNLARPAKRGAIEAEVRLAASLVRLSVADHRGERTAGDQAQAAGDQAQAAGHDGFGDSHPHELRRRLEELEVDGASTQVLAGDASSHTMTGGASSHTTPGDASSHTTPGDASSYDRAPSSYDRAPTSHDRASSSYDPAPSSDNGAYNVSVMDGSVEPSLLELDVDAAQVELDVDAAQVELDTGGGHGETSPPLTQARDTFLAVSADEEEPAYADEEKPAYADDEEPAYADDEAPAYAVEEEPAPHVAFAEHVVEYEPGLLNLVHSRYEDGESSDAEVGGDDEDGYHDGYRSTDEDGYHDLDDGYHGDDELLYSSDDEDVYAYPPNAMFDVSSIASAAASNHIPTSIVAYAPIHEAPAANISAAVPFTSRTPAAILPPAIPHVSDDAYEHHTPQYDPHTPQYDHLTPQYEHHTPPYDHHAPQYAAFFSESPSSYDVAMDFLPLSDLEGTPVGEAGGPVGEGAACEIVKGSENAEDRHSEDLIFPDDALFPIEPVIYETRETQKEAGIAWKEGGRVWKEEDMPLWTGDPSLDVPLEPSLDVPLEPLLGPLLKEERGVWRDDEAIPLPPLQMDRLPWLEGSDEEESPLSPMNGADLLLSTTSFGAELPALMAESPPLNEEVAVDEDAPFGDFPAGDNADFSLFPTDHRLLPYLLRLSAEYDGTPASELNGSPFPSPLPRSPFDENVLSFADASALPFADASALPFADASALPFASLSAQEIATGHQLVRRGRAGVRARRVVVERRSSQAQGDTMAQIESTAQVESTAPVDPTVLVDIAASSPLDVFLPHVRTPASAPELLDFFPAPSPFGDLADGMQSSESRALVRRPTEGEMAVVRAEAACKFRLVFVRGQC
ncbi:hypothetical protein EV714DRAFT_220198 [Schizophyllum commune]